MLSPCWRRGVALVRCWATSERSQQWALLDQRAPGSRLAVAVELVRCREAVWAL